MDFFDVKKWDIQKCCEFESYLFSLRNEPRIKWEKNIVNTKMNVLAIKANVLRNIAKNISKGDYISFLEIMPHKYYESCITDAYLISTIKNFNSQKKYINKLSKYIDNWSVVDAIKFNISGFEEEYLEYSRKLILSKKTFIRRIGVRILFSFVENDIYEDKIFDIIDSLINEKEYYVNMAVSWLLSELFIKKREKMLDYLNQHKLNKFVTNKMISKCRDSYRVSKEDKKMLLKYRIK